MSRMAIALAALLGALPLTVLGEDDPAVLYRDGLYEEIDQGNLERALERYDQVLASDASRTLKAKALVRKGHCLEKQGKKQEAGQAYQAVLDQYAGEAEAVRLAQARLASMERGDATGGAGLPAEIQSLILDLGSSDDQHKTAVRRLTVIGSPAIPDLQCALEHKDEMVCMGAAQVLMALEQYEGVYEAFHRAWEAKKGPGYMDAPGLARLLLARSQDRERFDRDVAIVPDTVLAGVLLADSHPPVSQAVRSSLEQRILDAGPSTWREDLRPSLDPLCQTLIRQTDAAGLGAFAERLLTATPPRLYTLELLLRLAWWQTEYKGAAPFELPPRVIGLMRPIEPAESFMRFIDKVAEHAPRADLMRWIATVGLRDSKAEMHEELAEFLWSPGRFPREELCSLAIQCLEDEDGGGRVKTRFLENLERESELSEKQTADLLRHCAGVISAGKPDDDAYFWDCIGCVLAHAAPDSRESTEALNKTFEHWETRGGIGRPPVLGPLQRLCVNKRLGEPQSSPRDLARDAALDDAALRALSSPVARARENALIVLEQASLKARLRIGPLLGDLPDEVAGQAIPILVAAYTPEEANAALEKMLPLLEPSTDRPTVRKALLVSLGRVDLPPNDAAKAIWQQALADPDRLIRLAAVIHFAQHAGGADATRELIQAVGDADDYVRLLAVEGLAAAPNLDAVPALIPLLHDTDKEVRDEVVAALQRIKEHYEEQANWRSWYETMKRLQEGDSQGK